MSQSSDDAKAATRKEMQGIIDFLTLQVQHKESELAKYQMYRDKYHMMTPFVNLAIQTTQHSIDQTQSQLKYYTDKLSEYVSTGRA